MDNTTPRKLNMEEKRKLEKLLIADIDTARAQFATNRSDERSQLEKEAISNPPVEVQKLYDKWKEAERASDKAEHDLEALGYRPNSYSGKLATYSASGCQPKALRAFDAYTD